MDNALDPLKSLFDKFAQVGWADATRFESDDSAPRGDVRWTEQGTARLNDLARVFAELETGAGELTADEIKWFVVLAKTTARHSPEPPPPELELPPGRP